MLELIMLICGIILLICPKSFIKEDKLKGGQTIESVQKQTRKYALVFIIITIILIILG